MIQQVFIDHEIQDWMPLADITHLVTSAAQDILAGLELFASYGKVWIPDIPGAQIMLHFFPDQADPFLGSS